jgi:hypothetical protein
MAREAGFIENSGNVYGDHTNLKAFEALVRADARDKWMERTAILIRGEREACAKLCKFDRTSADIETAIRARGETK